MAELHLLSPQGFRAGGVYAGIKRRKTPDIGLIVCERPAAAAAVFTANRVISPAVKVGREHVASGKLQAVVVNSGNANACTGRQGERDARRMCQLAGEIAGCDRQLVLPSSTGIIGHHLPTDELFAGIRATARGETVLAPSVAATLVRRTTGASTVTEREVEVLERLARRQSYQEISDELFITVHTVKSHAANIYGKLDVANRRQALLKAAALGWNPPA
ncbi:MAG TPA: bifunctional ornithine acetyltransferase/N-acetylglutamate synthase, partial [Thermomicrobiales bacterium]|nr:bifunctional ornithine acetyltransferase/N-acetylglutamate synthase [Thermomicrobiales bacterium]